MQVFLLLALRIIPLLERGIDFPDRSPFRVDEDIADVAEVEGKLKLGRTGGFGRRQL